MKRFGLLAACAAFGCGARTGLPDSRPDAGIPATVDLGCPPGFAECDGEPSSVCETETASSSTDCGGCGTRCESGLFCARGECVPGDRVAHLALGAFFSCVATAAGNVKCWGRNDEGQLGASVHQPFSAGVVDIADAHDVTQLSADALTVCARSSSSSIRCWGARPENAQFAPRKLAHVSAGDDAKCVLFSNGEASCWGENACGGLGVGDRASRSLANMKPARTDARTLAAGANMACVTMRSGATQCWGNTGFGAMGNGAPLERIFGGCGTAQPSPALALVPWAAASVEIGGFDTVCAIATNGHVACWGYAEEGEFEGIGPNLSPTRPFELSGVENVADVALGVYGGCARRNDGTVLCWGSAHSFDSCGLLANGGCAEVKGFYEVPGIHDAVEIDAGSSHTCVLRASGEVWCWGFNGVGQLGDGTTTNRLVPTKVQGL